MENGDRSRIASMRRPVRAPLCQVIHTSRLTMSEPVIETRYGVVGGFAFAPSDHPPSAPVVTAARSHDGAIRAPPIGSPLLSTSWPAEDHVVVGGVGVATGGVGVVGA